MSENGRRAEVTASHKRKKDDVVQLLLSEAGPTRIVGEIDGQHDSRRIYRPPTDRMHVARVLGRG